MSEKKMFLNCSSHAVVEPFRILTITLLSLLLPLSFLLLARLSTASFILAFSDSRPQPFSFLFSLFLYANPTLLHLLVSLDSVAALVHGLTGSRMSLLRDSPEPIFRPRLGTAWIFLCALLVCIGLVVEVGIGAGTDVSEFGRERSFFSRFVFFLGLHETMAHWSKVVVKPLVDDSVCGFAREERWAEKVAMSVSFGMLWWWRLRDEVESMVAVAEVKRDTAVGVGVGDIVGWWLYYMTLTIGMVRVVKGLMWVGAIFLCKRRRERKKGNSGESLRNAEKV